MLRHRLLRIDNCITFEFIRKTFSNDVFIVTVVSVKYLTNTNPLSITFSLHRTHVIHHSKVIDNRGETPVIV